jgi:hypothetical protein
MNTTEVEQTEQKRAPGAMPALEWQIHHQAVIAYNAGVAEGDFLREKARWRELPPEADTPNEDAPDRLEQALRTLKERDRWPWSKPMTGRPNDWLAVPQVAALVGCSEGWVRKEITRGNLTARQIGNYPRARGVWVVKRKDAEEYRDEREARLAHRFRKSRGAGGQD